MDIKWLIFCVLYWQNKSWSLYYSSFYVKVNGEECSRSLYIWTVEKSILCCRICRMPEKQLFSRILFIFYSYSFTASVLPIPHNTSMMVDYDINISKLIPTIYICLPYKSCCRRPTKLWCILEERVSIYFEIEKSEMKTDLA